MVTRLVVLMVTKMAMLLWTCWQSIEMVTRLEIITTMVRWWSVRWSPWWWWSVWGSHYLENTSFGHLRHWVHHLRKIFQVKNYFCQTKNFVHCAGMWVGYGRGDIGWVVRFSEICHSGCGVVFYRKAGARISLQLPSPGVHWLLCSRGGKPSSALPALRFRAPGTSRWWSRRRGSWSTWGSGRWSRRRRGPWSDRLGTWRRSGDLLPRPPPSLRPATTPSWKVLCEYLCRSVNMDDTCKKWEWGPR